MAFTELMDRVEAAFAVTEEKRYAYERAAAEHAATSDDAKAKLAAETAAADAERDRCIADARASYDATVKATDDARAAASAALDAARAELEALRAEANSAIGSLLGEPNQRVHVS